MSVISFRMAPRGARQDFLGFSHGFRPGRRPHDALDALATAIQRKRVNWVLDADFRDYFSSLDHRWLERFVEHRIADGRILRLIQKWLAAGVIEEGSWTSFEEGVPQGASASPLLANVYLHYVFDLWADQWRRRHARGQVVIVRFADDFVVGFEHRDDAERFSSDLRERLARFSLELNGEKTRLIRFGRFAAQQCQERGLGGYAAGGVGFDAARERLPPLCLRPVGPPMAVSARPRQCGRGAVC